MSLPNYENVEKSKIWYIVTNHIIQLSVELLSIMHGKNVEQLRGTYSNQRYAGKMIFVAIPGTIPSSVYVFFLLFHL